MNWLCRCDVWLLHTRLLHEMLGGPVASPSGRLGKLSFWLFSLTGRKDDKGFFVNLEKNDWIHSTVNTRNLHYVAQDFVTETTVSVIYGLNSSSSMSHSNGTWYEITYVFPAYAHTTPCYTVCLTPEMIHRILLSSESARCALPVWTAPFFWRE